MNENCNMPEGLGDYLVALLRAQMLEALRNPAFYQDWTQRKLDEDESKSDNGFSIRKPRFETPPPEDYGFFYPL